MNRLLVAMSLSVLVVGTACKARKAENSLKDVVATTPAIAPIDYEKMSPEVGLDKKYELMLPLMRNDVEREVLRVVHKTLREGRKTGQWMNVDMEDLMAHSHQEAGWVIGLLNSGKDLSVAGAIGTNVWDFRMVPGNDLNGFVSFSVWQGIEINYLRLGRKFDDNLKSLYDKYIVGIAFSGRKDLSQQEEGKLLNGYKNKLVEVHGKEEAKRQYDDLIDKITKAVAARPELHVMVISDLIEENYAVHGWSSPKSIRSYFWLAIQKNLNPENWYKPVMVKDDKPPTAANGMVDVNAGIRGDYAKQIVLGNTYNDRGLIFYFAATRDLHLMKRLIKVWESDPARLRKKDYKFLLDGKYLNWAAKNPEIYEFIYNTLPE